MKVPKNLTILWVNTTALNITFIPAKDSSEVEFFKAVFGQSTCEVKAKTSPLRCTLGGLEGGTE